MGAELVVAASVGELAVVEAAVVNSVRVGWRGREAVRWREIGLER